MEFLKNISKLFYIFLLLLAACAPQPSMGKKIVIWHWMNDRKSAFDTLAAKYKQEAGISVEFKLFSPPDIYSQKVIAAARAGNLPDIFGIIGEKKTLGSFISAGHILDVTPFMHENAGEWKNSFYPQALGVVTFLEDNSFGVAPGIYAVPIDTTVIQFVYNRSFFKDSGLDPNNPPDTFVEFLDYAKKIKTARAIEGFVCGWGEGWLLNCLATEYAINIMGEEKFIKTLKGEIPYTNKEWLEVFSLFEQLRDSGILYPNITTMINKEAEDAFSKGKAAFSFNGSWAVNVYKQLGPDLDYAFFSLPKARKATIKIWGGAGSSFMVNKKSANIPEAVRFLKWLTSKEQQVFLIQETNNLPAIKGCEGKLPDILKTLVDDLDSLTHPNVWPYNEDSRVLEVMNTGLQQIIMGIKSAKQLASEIQQEKERLKLR